MIGGILLILLFVVEILFLKWLFSKPIIKFSFCLIMIYCIYNLVKELERPTMNVSKSMIVFLIIVLGLLGIVVFLALIIQIEHISISDVFKKLYDFFGFNGPKDPKNDTCNNSDKCDNKILPGYIYKFDDDYNYIGYVNNKGYIYRSKDGYIDEYNYVGYVTEDGYIYKFNDDYNYIGYVTENGRIYNFDDDYVGYVDEKNQIYNFLCDGWPIAYFSGESKMSAGAACMLLMRRKLSSDFF